MFGQALDEPWFGMVGIENGRPVGFGTIVWDAHGRAWGHLNLLERASPFVLHRMAVRVIGWLRETGQPDLWATCSETIPGARKWLERLGFRHESGKVWVKCLTT